MMCFLRKEKSKQSALFIWSLLYILMCKLSSLSSKLVFKLSLEFRIFHCLNSVLITQQKSNKNGQNNINPTSKKLSGEKNLTYSWKI